MINRQKSITENPSVLAIFSVVLGLGFGLSALLLSGYNPLLAIKVMGYNTFGKLRFFLWILIQAVPIIFTGISVAFAYRTGLFNIGAEGQFIIGALVAALVGYYVRLPMIIHPIVVLLCSIIAASIWGGIAGWLKAQFGVHEVISTIMLNWIALYLNNFILNFPQLRRPESEATHKVLFSARIDLFSRLKEEGDWYTFQTNHPQLADVFRAPITIGILLAVLTAIIIWILIEKTNFGYKLKMVGFNKDAALYQGVSVTRSYVSAMLISGALAGIGGACHVLGVTHEVAKLAAMEGNGFDGIAVALIANAHPIGTIFSGILFSALAWGGKSIQRDLGAPTEVVNIVIGIIIFFIAAPGIFKTITQMRYQRKMRRKQ